MSILVQYVNEILTPTEDQIQFIKSNIKTIKEVLTHNSPTTPKEIHFGGSFVKGTMLRYDLDADLVFIYNRSKEIKGNWLKLSKILFNVLKENFREVEIEEVGNLAIHLKKPLDKQLANFDIVPCYYVNSPKMMEEHVSLKLYIGITTI
jgi:tRNA nucleotidyltransferase (CCA-adding enzyme)